ncbi:MAG: two-component regulator propeller domain-containing protein [Sediminibacterium sp.]
MQKWLYIIIGIIGSIKPLNAQLQLGPIGTWRAHFSNESIHQIIKGDQLYIAAANQVIQIDAKKQVNYLNTTNGLHAIGIHKIAWHPIEKQLVIAYKNSRIDIVQGDQVTLIDDIQLSNLYADKTINDLVVLNNNAYLSCNFGIVIIDLLKKEIKETAYPNNNRKAVKVLQTVSFQNKLFALTDNGIWSTVLGQNNSWTKENTMDIAGIQNMFVFKNQLYFNNQQKVYAYPSNMVRYQINSGSIETILVDEENVFAGITDQNKGALMQLNSNQNNTVLLDSMVLIQPKSILKDGNTIWIADEIKGLYEKNEQPKWVSLGGPLSYIKGSNAFSSNQILMSYGTNKIGISSLNENGWSNFTQIQNLKLNSIESVSIDPVDQSWWLGMGSELIHFDPNKKTVEQFLPSSTAGSIKSIQQKIDGSCYLLKEGVGILAKEGNQWNSYSIQAGYSAQNLKQFVVDGNGLSWIIGPKQQGILLFQKQNNQAIWRQLNTGKGSGNLPSMEVTAITEDKDGSIWIGTDNGIAVLQCNNINEACDAYLPIVESNGFNGYLFQNETVHSITIDGANRKWIGTNNGAWLISKDGTEVLQHFTTENSPLPNNTVLSIGIEPTDGDVFFFTENEIISYKGDATESAINQQKIKIYPNPVAPNYYGPILIKNLVNNALVKITNLNGHLMMQTRALGGQAIWNGRDQYQHKVASGIYLVFVRDDAGNEKGVGKIMITSGN